jgi:hypothetical protein
VERRIREIAASLLFAQSREILVSRPSIIISRD